MAHAVTGYTVTGYDEGMTITRTALATAAIALTLTVPASASDGRAEYMPCASEDSLNCVWDARHMGNGVGRSYFTGRDGRVWYLPHHIAHRLIYGE